MTFPFAERCKLIARGVRRGTLDWHDGIDILALHAELEGLDVMAAAVMVAEALKGPQAANDNVPRHRPTPDVVVEALLYALRDGFAAFERNLNCLWYLQLCDAPAFAELCRRLKRWDPVAQPWRKRTWSDDELNQLMRLRRGLRRTERRKRGYG